MIIVQYETQNVWVTQSVLKWQPIINHLKKSKKNNIFNHMTVVLCAPVALMHTEMWSFVDKQQVF